MKEQAKSKRTKRANGRGSIYKRSDGKGYRGQQYINGIRKSYSAKTKTEIEQLMEKDRVESRDLNLQCIQNSEVTVAEWLSYWLEKKKKPYVKEQTYKKLYMLCTKHIIPVLGQYRVQSLNVSIIEDAYKTMAQKENGELYSDSFIKQISVVLKSCLESAVIEGILVRNPHKGAIVPKGIYQKEINPYTAEEQSKIVDYCKNSKRNDDRLFYILVATGMREGEAEALTWDCIDLKESTIQICKTRLLQRNSAGELIQENAKTRKSTRKISISKNVNEFLKALKKENDEEKNKQNLVFYNRNYNSFAPDYLRRRFKVVCEELNISYHGGLHCLRHTWATRALELGIPIKVVSDMLGHEKTSTTMDIYQSVLREKQEDAVNILNGLY